MNDDPLAVCDISTRPPPVIYDVHLDIHRAITQADVDSLWAGIQGHGLMVTAMRALLDDMRAFNAGRVSWEAVTARWPRSSLERQETPRESLQQTLTAATEALGDADREAGGTGPGVAA